MAFDTARIRLFDRNMEPLPEIAPSELYSATMTEEINGEHELVIETRRRLEEGWRALTVDATGKWREWVVTETPQEHSTGRHAIGTYRMVWSLQYDLTNAYFHDTGEAVSIGMGTSTPASVAAGHVVSAATGWSVGTCTAPDIPAGTGCVFIRESSWSKLSKLIECTGFEVDANIVVSNVFGVESRELILTTHVGSEEATRRFDWGEDVTDIKRTPDPGPYYCRVVPLGKGEQEYADDDETTFDYPIDITEEVDEHGDPYPYYLQDDEAALAFRYKKPDGSWFYPTIAVSYSEDDPELLLNAAMEELHDYTRPNVTYEADVMQLAQAGMDVHGVALGDEIQIVDRGFNPDAALRLQGRVTKVEVDLLSPETGTALTIGNLRDNMTDRLGESAAALDQLTAQNAAIRESLNGMNTAKYVQELLERINTEIAATGGYTYLTEGEGLITYDKAVVDPLTGMGVDGSYANRVVQLKGGYLRIADSKKSGFSGIDDWEFKTILESGHIIADLVTAVKVTAGYIGNATNGNYWNLDTGQLVLRMFYDVNSGGILNTGPSLYSEHGYVVTLNAEDYFDMTGGISGSATRHVPGFKVSNRSAATTANPDGAETSYIVFSPYGSNYSSSGSWYRNVMSSSKSLTIWAGYDDPSGRSRIEMQPHSVSLKISDHSYYRYPSSGYDREPQISINQSRILLRPYSSSGSSSYDYGDQSNCYQLDSSGHTLTGDVTIDGTLSVDSLSSSNAMSLGDYVSIDKYNVTISDGPNSANGTANPARFTSTHITARNSVNTVNLYATGTISNSIKSRLINTDDYGKRLLFCYETPTPTFGDIGSGVTDDDGFCYVLIDDVFAETAHTDFSYQVFLQKCGPGDIWVKEKTSTYFLVEGTPNLGFDWELKARQVDSDVTRLDDFDLWQMDDDAPRDAVGVVDYTAALYGDTGTEASDIADETADGYDDDYISELEHIYDDDLAA